MILDFGVRRVQPIPNSLHAVLGLFIAQEIPAHHNLYLMECIRFSQLILAQLINQCLIKPCAQLAVIAMVQVNRHSVQWVHFRMQQVKHHVSRAQEAGFQILPVQLIVSYVMLEPQPSMKVPLFVLDVLQVNLRIGVVLQSVTTVLQVVSLTDMGLLPVMTVLQAVVHLIRAVQIAHCVA